ncbi:hypothetical protein [Kitasatospora azatica]|uniref:hypothetical protein n=1 Tax=Kitasatospora azatica TaxID=58347 RepID=UPI0012FAE358|nr:hypothetical protein [Kitasatospora azatica]
MAVKDARDLQFWGTVAVVGAALAVVAAYLVDGAPLVWAVASVEVLLVMVHVARRFRSATQAHHAHHGRPDIRPDAAHCERCRRAREQRSTAERTGSERTGFERTGSERAGSGGGVGHQRDAHVLHDEGPEGEGVEDFVEPEPTR